MNRWTWGVPVIAAAFVLFQGCANDVRSQQMSAYSIATGFLTLCDDGDFDNALNHFARPLKASPRGPNWVKDMQDKRAPFGMPVIRALVSRNGQKLSTDSNGPANINFVFRTSFIGTTPGDESVSLKKLDGKWQVYDYKFRPSGKPASSKPTATPKKSWEEQTDQDSGQYRRNGW